jgi:hypothetical protein
MAPAEARTFILLVDDLSFAPSRGKAMLNAAARFIDRVPPSDPVGFTTTSGIGAVNPTRERVAVRAALSNVMGQFNDPRGMRTSGPVGGARLGASDSPLGITESIDIERGDDTLLRDVIVRECFAGDRNAFNGVSLAEILADSNPCPSDVRREARQVASLIRQNKGRQIAGITSVIAAMTGADGIRHLVLLSDGLPVSREVNDLHPLVRRAAEAGVQLSVLMPDPDISVTDDARGESMSALTQTDPGQSRRRREDDLLFVSGLQTMTDMLGGTFHRVIGAADPFFDRVLVASSAVYRLGVELPPGAKPGDVYDVSVSVKRPGVKARANRFSVAAAPAATTALPPAPAAAAPPAAPASPRRSPESIENALKSELGSKRVSSGVPIRIAAFLRRTAGAPDAVDINLGVVVSAAAPGPITGCLALMDQPGGFRTNCRTLESPGPHGYAASYLLPLAAGDYRFRFAVMDAAGAIGSIELPVRGRLEPVGPFIASDVLTWFVDEGNTAQLFAVDRLPSGVDTLRASLELYPGSAPIVEAPVVKWSLTPVGAESPLRELESPVVETAGIFRADAAFPAAGIPPGPYVLRAAVWLQGRAAGSRAAVIKR